MLPSKANPKTSMSFLNQELAASLQYVTVPLEFVGIILAILELRFPRASLWASEHILREGQSYLLAINSKLAIKTALGVGIGLVLVLTLEYSNLQYGSELMLYACFSLAFSYAIAAYWLPDRAIGTFGLCLASFGLCGEIYQLTTMLMGPTAN